jgi:hypothetical protein
MRRILLLPLTLMLLAPSLTFAQGGVSTPVISSAEPLPNCTPAATNLPGYIIFDRTANLLKYCSALNTWTAPVNSSQIQLLLSSPGATTDATSLINAAVALGGTFYLNPGTYALKTGGQEISIATSNVNMICLPGATIQAQTGFTASSPEINILAGTSNVLVRGCTLDGNGIASYGGGPVGSATQVWFDQNTFKNHTVYGITSNGWTGSLLQITNNIFTSEPEGLFVLAGDSINWGTDAPSLVMNGNTFGVMSAASGQAASAIGISSFKASDNNFAGNGAGTNAALYGYGVDSVNWQHNSFYDEGGAVHCDTCGGGNISDNYSLNDTGNLPDYFAEIGTKFSIRGNVSVNNTGSYGILAGTGNGSQGQAYFRTVLQSFNSNAGITAGTNVALTSDAVDYQAPSTASMVATANGSFTTGVLWYYNFSAQTVWAPYISLWVKPTSGNVAYGALKLCFSISANAATCDLPVVLPAFTNSSWSRIIQYASGWQAALNLTGSPSGFQSVGIVVTASSPSLAVKFDGLDYSEEMLGYTIEGNKIINPLNYAGCMQVGALQGGVIRDNYCEFQSSGSAAQAYVVQNSTNILFSGNTSNFYAGPAAAAYQVLVDATSNASNIYDENDITNSTATPIVHLTNGGTYSGPSFPAINLRGATSGTTTITPPAVASTAINPIVFSNALQVPCGSTGHPSYMFAGDTATGLWDFGCGGSGALVVASAGPSIYFETSGNSNLATMTGGSFAKYAGLTTAGLGNPAILGTLDLTGQSTTNSGSAQNVLASTPQAGHYRLFYYADQNAGCTTIGSAAFTLTAGWTDATHARAPASAASFAPTTGAVSTNAYVSGMVDLWAAASSAITVTATYIGCNSGTWTYDIHAEVEEVE